MKILLTGVTGYIGKRLLIALINKKHNVVCCIRDKNRLNLPAYITEHIEIIEADFLNAASLENIPNDIDAAYYLIHSMSSSRDFKNLEKQCAGNFREAIEKTNAKQVIFLSGIINENVLSEHLDSRKAVEDELKSKKYL